MKSVVDKDKIKWIVESVLWIVVGLCGIAIACAYVYEGYRGMI